MLSPTAAKMCWTPTSLINPSVQQQPEMRMGRLDRIASDPAIFGGKPIVRGMRISVELILSLLAQGHDVRLLDRHGSELPGSIVTIRNGRIRISRTSPGP
jgi:uncharacterized protein (DUF433 family)